MLQEKEETLTLEQCVTKWGGSISEAILESNCQHFSIPEIEGVIGYRLAENCAIILGDPICAEEDKPRLAHAFESYCKENHLSFIYFITSETFAKWAINHSCKILIEVAEEIIFDPSFDSTLGHKGHRLRNRINHAQNSGLSVHEYLTHDEELEKNILNVGKEWLKERHGPQIYLGDLNFFKNKTDRRWFYLQNNKKEIKGMAMLRQLDASQGWLLKFLIVTPDTPRGTSELLMTFLLETLRKEGCRYLTYGMVPADKLGEVIGMNTFMTYLTKVAFKITKWIFHLEQRKLYWQKFHPRDEKVYLLFSSPSIGIKEIKALSLAMKIDFQS
jgi:lysylphosphatidylglycerol synthetase-like protein (DUF2156 family)